MRLALGGNIVLEDLAYEVRGEGGEVVHRGSIGVAGKGSDDLLWMELGNPGEGSRMSVTVGGVGAKAETAARFWWMPGDVYREGEATGCVPRPGGDCLFRLARRYGWGEWVAEFPALVGELAPEVGENTLSWLLVARMAFLAALVCSAGAWRCTGARHR